MTMIQRLSIAIIGLLVTLQLPAQVNQQEEYEKFRQQAIKKYVDFRDKANQEYAEFMKQAWNAMAVKPPTPRPKDEPTPPVVVPKEDENKVIENHEIKVKVVIKPVEPKPQPLPVAPIKEEPIPEEPMLNFQFYGTPCHARLYDDMKVRVSSCSEAVFSDCWKKMSNDKRYNNLIRDCLEARIMLSLGDWAYLQYLQTMSENFYGKGTNEATLLTAYLFCQSGYSMRLGMANGRLYLLYSCENFLFDYAYVYVPDQWFYPTEKCQDTKIKICNMPFPGEKSMQLDIAQSMNLAINASEERTVKSRRYPEATIKFVSNKNLIDFFNTYPTSTRENNFMTRWAYYANTPISDSLAQNFYQQWKTIIGSETKKQATEILLNWVQTGLVYEYDDKVWGGDRAFFPEESLYYPYCDCEDRSILFTRMVRDLLGLECVLIYYPGHLACAVHFDEEVKGDFIMVNGKRYTVCDPTFIGARIGMTMTGMDNSTATAILLQ